MALTITITLTDDEEAAVTAMLNTSWAPPPNPPVLATSWIAQNVAALVAQCTSAQKDKMAQAAGLGADLTKFGVTDAEQDAIIATRVQAKAAAIEAATAAAASVEAKPA